VAFAGASVAQLAKWLIVDQNESSPRLIRNFANLTE